MIRPLIGAFVLLSSLWAAPAAQADNLVVPCQFDQQISTHLTYTLSHVTCGDWQGYAVVGMAAAVLTLSNGAYQGAARCPLRMSVDDCAAIAESSAVAQ